MWAFMSINAVLGIAIKCKIQSTIIQLFYLLLCNSSLSNNFLIFTYYLFFSVLAAENAFLTFFLCEDTQVLGDLFSELDVEKKEEEPVVKVSVEKKEEEPVKVSHFNDDDIKRCAVLSLVAIIVVYIVFGGK